MTTNLGTESRALRVAVVGSGPSGFYAAEALFRADLVVDVHMFDRLPTPYGLLRGGVAPDHQKMKSLASAYEKIALNERFSFYGNVNIGVDISISELQDHYDAIVVASGAESDRALGIPGEQLSGSHTATEFVGWYNGHPDYQDRTFDLSQRKVAIIGQGNVAIDVCRILAKTPEELMDSDITEHALNALRDSNVEDIYLIGRRGPVQTAFTELEIKEMGELDQTVPIVLDQDLDLSAVDLEEMELPKQNKARKNIAVLETFKGNVSSQKPKRVHIRFLLSPVEIKGQGAVSELVLERNQLEGAAGAQKARGTGDHETLDVGLVFRSIGYRGIPIEGLPFDENYAVIPNEKGRIITQDGNETGLYVTGWIKRGPSGVIGTNRADSKETIATLLEDLPNFHEKEIGSITDLLSKKGCRVISFEDWKRIDEEEVRRGQEIGKPREKFTSVQDMLNFIGGG